MSEGYNTIKSLIENFLDKMGVEGSVEFVEASDMPVFTIQTNEAGILIGEGGQNLFSLSHVLKKIINNIFKEEESPEFLLDVNGYFTKKINGIKETARLGAQRAIFFKKEVELEPMNAFERRAVHEALGEYPDIKTESVGYEGVDRRVVIKPV